MMLITAVILLLLSAAIGAWVWQQRGMLKPAQHSDDLALRTVAVLPFENLSRHPDDATIALAVPDIVLDRLTTVQGLTVVARDSAFRVGTAPRDLADIERKLHAGFLVDGTVQRNGATLRVTARLVEARTQRQLWSNRYDRPVADLFAMQDEIAEQVAAALRERLPGVRGPAAAAAPTHDIDAYLAWLRGRTLVGRYTAAKAEAAAAEFQHAIGRDPMFAAAYVALYDARMQSASLRFEDANAARRLYRPLLDRALALDPNSGAVLFARAMWDDLDDPTREATFRAAVALDPGNSRGLTAFADFLDVVSMRSSAGKLRGSGLFPTHSGAAAPPGDARDLEAASLLERAVKIDPLFAPARYSQFDRANLGRKAAESRMEELLAIDPDFYPALVRLAKYRWLFHESPSQAIALLERAIAADPQNPLGRQDAAALYLEIGEDAAAADVAAATPVSYATAAPALALYSGDWRAAGGAAQEEASFTLDVFYEYLAPQALRDMALRTRDFARVEDLLCKRYAMSLDGPIRIELYNFRTWVLLAHLELAQGRSEQARGILASVIAWIDADREFGPVYNRRTKAQALMLLGQREDALRELTASFHVDRDYVEWRYTIEWDPIFNEVRRRPEFQALATEARHFAARERDAVEALRKRGEIPRRPVDPSTAHAPAS
jgi:TolB-like protein